MVSPDKQEKQTSPDNEDQVLNTSIDGKRSNPIPFNNHPLTDSPPESIASSLITHWIQTDDGKSKEFEITQNADPLDTKVMRKRRPTTLDIPGLTHSKSSPDGTIGSANIESKLVIIMVGLPARGKSYITNKLCRYLNWLQHNCQVFNVGNTRRQSQKQNPGDADKAPSRADSATDEAKESTEHNANLFSPDNEKAVALREKWAMDTLSDLLDFLIDGRGTVGIFDATNTTADRRQHVLKTIKERSDGALKVLYLESICNDPEIIESNVRLKLSGPDYKDVDQAKALKDFVNRMRNYEKIYETISEEEEKDEGVQYIKMINVGRKVIAYNIHGFLASQTVYYLLNFNLEPRQIWLTRHGESEDNVLGKIGGDSKLTPRGIKYAKALSKFMEFKKKEFREQQLTEFQNKRDILKDMEMYKNGRNSTPPDELNFSVWTSMLRRSIESSQYFDEDQFFIKEHRMLNELNAGICDGMTYQEISSRYPEEFAARLHNKLTYRYRGVGGESYLDVINRLKPLIAEIERTTDNLLIVSHRVIIRILLGYFLNIFDQEKIGNLDVPLHDLFLLESKPYGVDWEIYEYDEDNEWFKKIYYSDRKVSIGQVAKIPSKNQRRILKLQQEKERECTNSAIMEDENTSDEDDNAIPIDKNSFPMVKKLQGANRRFSVLPSAIINKNSAEGSSYTTTSIVSGGPVNVGFGNSFKPQQWSRRPGGPGPVGRFPDASPNRTGRFPDASPNRSGRFPGASPSRSGYSSIRDEYKIPISLSESVKRMTHRHDKKDHE